MIRIIKTSQDIGTGETTMQTIETDLRHTLACLNAAISQLCDCAAEVEYRLTDLPDNLGATQELGNSAYFNIKKMRHHAEQVKNLIEWLDHSVPGSPND